MVIPKTVFYINDEAMTCADQQRESVCYKLHIFLLWANFSPFSEPHTQLTLEFIGSHWACNDKQDMVATLIER